MWKREDGRPDSIAVAPVGSNVRSGCAGAHPATVHRTVAFRWVRILVSSPTTKKPLSVRRVRIVTWEDGFVADVPYGYIVR